VVMIFVENLLHIYYHYYNLMLVMM